MSQYSNSTGDFQSEMGFDMPALQGYQGMRASHSGYDGFDAQRQNPGQTRPASGASYEDASMHLKLQSLPILDSLVSPMFLIDLGYALFSPTAWQLMIVLLD